MSGESPNRATPSNKALERTRRVGVPRLRGAVVGVPPCRSTRCWTDRGTDRSAFVPPPSAVADAPAARTAENVPAWAALVKSLHQSRPALGPCPDILRHPVGPVSTGSFPSASLWLGINGQRTSSDFPGRDSTVMGGRPSNKGLERTRRVGVPATRAVIRVSPCRSTPCSTDAKS
jgi:hypothetical protein